MISKYSNYYPLKRFLHIIILLILFQVFINLSLPTINQTYLYYITWFDYIQLKPPFPTFSVAELNLGPLLYGINFWRLILLIVPQLRQLTNLGKEGRLYLCFFKRIFMLAFIILYATILFSQIMLIFNFNTIIEIVSSYLSLISFQFMANHLLNQISIASLSRGSSIFLFVNNLESLLYLRNYYWTPFWLFIFCIILYWTLFYTNLVRIFPVIDVKRLPPNQMFPILKKDILAWTKVVETTTLPIIGNASTDIFFFFFFLNIYEQYKATILSPQDVILVYFLFTVIKAPFASKLRLNTNFLAQSLRKRSLIIPEIMWGPPTKNYFDVVLFNLNIINQLYLIPLFLGIPVIFNSDTVVYTQVIGSYLLMIMALIEPISSIKVSFLSLRNIF